MTREPVTKLRRSPRRGAKAGKPEDKQSKNSSDQQHKKEEPKLAEELKVVSTSTKRKPCGHAGPCDHEHEHEDEPTRSSPRGVDFDPDKNQIAFVDKLADLNRISEEDVQLAVWRQSEEPKFVTKLSDPSIEPEDLPAFEGMVIPGNMVARYIKERMWVPYKLRSHEKRKRALDEEGIDQLVRQIEELVQVFSDIAIESGYEDELIHVKLHVVDDDKCKFWHQDCVPFRLISTFRGPCTEWVDPKFSRKTLEHRQSDSKHAQSLTHCDVALFKGRGDDVNNDQFFDAPGIVHRSPRLTGSGAYRLVLVLDIPQEGMHY